MFRLPNQFAKPRLSAEKSPIKQNQIGSGSSAFSAFMLLFRRHKGHLTCKNFCLKNHWDAVNISEQGAVQCIM